MMLNSPLLDIKNLQVSINETEILKNLNIIADLLFKYYPKRRKIFISRLLDKPVIKSLINYELDGYFIQEKLIKNNNADIAMIRDYLVKFMEERENFT